MLEGLSAGDVQNTVRELLKKKQIPEHEAAVIIARLDELDKTEKAWLAIEGAVEHHRLRMMDNR